ncbi:hypothetical protein EUX98_g844 [Antrodiella citrinella]|uniref:Beta-galactosidase jelly roll domain-containing protein n=1 Tax=Antrodiella citrinella TaxID=2447956 RepID=A0A4V3XJJ4_9APHY|nr:hypothetical protein EUX98_g844 [Antrodiella citrinella]
MRPRPLTDHMGIVETSTNSGKEPRGIRGYSMIGGNTTFSYWKLQGNQGGAANAPDKVRGYLNEGGLWAERVGAHLPGYPDDDWEQGNPLGSFAASVNPLDVREQCKPLGGLSVPVLHNVREQGNPLGGIVFEAQGPSTSRGPGVNFYRTTFNPNIPDDVDVPVRLSITPSAQSSNFRIQIYLNGWQLGKYINNIGPQTVYVLPAGLLRPRSTNTLALSVWSLDANGSSIAGLSLISDGTLSTGLNISDYTLAPDYEAQKDLRPTGRASPPM